MPTLLSAKALSRIPIKRIAKGVDAKGSPCFTPVSTKIGINFHFTHVHAKNG